MIGYYPSTTNLMDLISAVPRFPISAGQLVELAQNLRADPAVVEFYQGFPDGVVFQSRDDLISRSELVDMMNREELEQPHEVLVSAEED